MRLAVATPVDGTPETARVCYAVQLAMRRLRAVDWLDLRTLTSNVDISRARDRLARAFLYETEADACLWWDEDVLPENLDVIRRMVESGKDVIGAPYRRKKDPESYPYQPLEEHVDVRDGIVRVKRLAMGFMLTSRRAVQRVWDAYHAGSWYFDIIDGKSYETVSLFGLLYTDPEPGPDGKPWRTMLSEDYSFCERARSVGLDIHMLLEPVTHIGQRLFRGSPEGVAMNAR